MTKKTTILLDLKQVESILAGVVPDFVRIQLRQAQEYLSQDWVRASSEDDDD